MNTIFSLSLSASLMVVMLYPVFRIMVNRCRSFKFNRMLMLSGIAIIIFASIDLTLEPTNDAIPLNTSVQANNFTKPDVPASEGNQPSSEISGLEFLPWILNIYWIGILVLIGRQIISYANLWRILSKSEKEHLDGYVLCRHEYKGIAPFSWGRFIVLPSSENEKSILIHEKAHTFKRHWIDVTIADLLCIFIWYNPFAWMLKSLIKLNHEYEADAEVIGSSIDVLSYQKLLITKALGNRKLHIANNFAMSKKDFRRRVLIMSQSYSSRRIKWVAAAILPALALTAYADTTQWAIAIHEAIASCKFPLTTHQKHTTEAVTDTSIERETFEEVQGKIITKRLPSPLTDPNPLLQQFELAMELTDKDLIPNKLLVSIQTDEDGNIVSATTDHDDNPEVRVVVERATNQVAFDIVKDGDRKVSTRFAIPIRKEYLPM